MTRHASTDHGDRRHERRRGRSEDGAVAIVVAIMMALLIGIASLAIDLGSAWETKRDLVTDLDAAALAGAYELAIRDPDCNFGLSAIRETAGDWLALNNPSHAESVDVSGGGDITVVCDASERSVEVRARLEASTVFRPSFSVSGFSKAVVEEDPIVGIMPLVICVNDRVIRDFDAGGQQADGTVYELGDPADPDNQVAGNCVSEPPDGLYSQAPFRDPADVGPSMQAFLEEMVEGGNQPTIVLPPPSPARCGDPDDEFCYVGDPDGTADIVQRIGEEHGCAPASDECSTVAFVVVSDVTLPTYKFAGVLRAIVRSGESEPGPLGRLRLEPLEYVTEGSFDEFATAPTVRLCGADAAGDTDTC